MDIYMSLNINIGRVTKNLEMLKIVPDHLNTNNMCKNGVKNLPYPLRHVPDECKTRQMCDRANLENNGTINPDTEYYKNQ